MKYIRTKDGIFEFAKRFNLEHYKSVGFSDEDIVRKFTRNWNKIADTIEELCDEFVIEFEDKSHCLMEDKSKIKDAYQINKAYRSIIYGAIWTDKGLQFVARMNSEGVLELL